MEQRRSGADQHDGVLILMLRDARRATGPVSVWLTAAGWADAAAETHGRSWMVTPSGVLDGATARRIATEAPQPGKPRSGWKALIPTELKTLRSDILSWRRARSFRNAGLNGPWEHDGPAWIWHHFVPFHDSGFRAAEKFGRPVVVFVDAPTVWEAEQWGVKRPGWGRLLERLGETPQLRKADLIACVTEEVAEEVIRLGADERRVVVTPTAIDPARFHPGVEGMKIRQRYGFEGQTVIGWLGTFHRFHGIDMLIEAYAALEAERENISLLLVGDGQDRPHIEALIRERGLKNVVLTGSVAQDDVPAHIAAMDVATVVDPGTGSFHYSPLKLKEYMALGRAIIAPDSGQVSRYIGDSQAAKLVPAGDVPALVAAIRELVEDEELRAEMGAAAEVLVLETGTWASQLRVVEDALKSLGLLDGTEGVAE